MHRIAWDLRLVGAELPPAGPAKEGDEDLFRVPDVGPLVLPGKYRVRLLLRQDGVARPVEGAEQDLTVSWFGTNNETARKALYEFQVKLTALRKALAGTLESAREVQNRLTDIRRALDQAPGAKPADRARVVVLEEKLRAILRALRGDVGQRRRNENTPLSVADRVNAIHDEQRYSLAAPTATHRRLYAEASAELAEELEKLRALMEKDLKAIEKVLDTAGSPRVPGRLPEWKER
jgi:hypothetical protein